MKKSKKEKSLIAFMTNGDVRSISETALPNYKKIDFLLVPVNGGDATSYLYVSSSKLLHFTKAKIKYIFTAYYFGDGCCDKAVQMDEEEKEITSLIDLCNLLHSFIRYRRIYNMENSYIDENMPPSMLIEPDLFELELYSGEELIYSKYIPDNSKVPSDKYVIIDKIIEDFFDVEECEAFSYTKDSEFLVVRNNTWKIVKKSRVKASDIVGIASKYTKTFIFFEYSQYVDLLNSVKDISISFNVIDHNQYPYIDDMPSNEVHDSIGYTIPPIKSVFIWLKDHNDIISIMDMLLIYGSIMLGGSNVFFKTYYPDLYKKMDLRLYTIFCIDFLSIKLRSDIMAFPMEKLPNATDFMNAMTMIRGEL